MGASERETLLSFRGAGEIRRGDRAQRLIISCRGLSGGFFLSRFLHLLRCV